MILYIHGFASSSKSNKVNMLREKFENVEAFDLSPEPNKAILKLEEYIEQNNTEKITLIGSSLGGYYAMYLSAKYDLNVILINPSTQPWKTLERYKNKEVINYSTNKTFNFKSEYLQQLKELKIINIKQSKVLLLLQTGDETLDYKEAMKYLPEAKTILESGGSHQFDDFDNYFEMINKFL